MENNLLEQFQTQYQLALKLLQDEHVQQTFLVLTKRFELKPFLLVQLILFILYVLYRSINLPYDSGFLGRLIWNLSLMFLYQLGALVAIPLMLYQVDYWNFLKALVVAIN